MSAVWPPHFGGEGNAANPESHQVPPSALELPIVDAPIMATRAGVPNFDERVT